MVTVGSYRGHWPGNSSGILLLWEWCTVHEHGCIESCCETTQVGSLAPGRIVTREASRGLVRLSSPRSPAAPLPAAPATNPTPIRPPRGRRAQRSSAAGRRAGGGKEKEFDRGSMSLVSGAFRRRARIGR
jgi:hypothetical protein